MNLKKYFSIVSGLLIPLFAFLLYLSSMSDYLWMKFGALVIGVYLLWWMVSEINANKRALTAELPPYFFICMCDAKCYAHKHQIGQLVRCLGCNEFIIVPLMPGTRAVKAVFERSSERLDLKLASKADWKPLMEIYGDARNFDYEFSDPYTRDDLKKKLHASRFPAGFIKTHSLYFKVVQRESQKVVGIMTLAYSLPYYSVHIGIMIHHDFTNQGYGREALKSMVALLFDQLGVHKINVMCDSKNLRCLEMLKAADFDQEALIKDTFYHLKRGWVDSPLYVLFNSRSAPEVRNAVVVVEPTASGI